MAKSFVIQTGSGPETVNYIVGFIHEINGEKFNFVIHKAQEYVGSYSLSEKKSGLKVRDIPVTKLLAYGGHGPAELKAAGQAVLRETIEKYGEDRVYSAIVNRRTK